MKKRDIYFGKILFGSMFVLLSCCKTAPDVPDPNLMTAVPLENGASIYVFADVKKAQHILDILPIDELKDRNTQQMLERTSFFTAGLYPQESGRRLQLAAWGDYPSSFVSMAFAANKSWVKQQSKRKPPYWYSPADRLSVAVNQKQAFAVSWLGNTPGSPVTEPPWTDYPEGFGEFRRRAPFSCWIENPGSEINQIFDTRDIPFHIPLQRLFVNLFTEDGEDGQEEYYAVIRMQFSTVSQARSIAGLFTLAQSFLGNIDSTVAQIFLANPVDTEDRNLDIKTDRLREEEIALLFNTFLLH